MDHYIFEGVGGWGVGIFSLTNNEASGTDDVQTSIKSTKGFYYCKLWSLFVKAFCHIKVARNSFVGRAQTWFQFTRETQKLKQTNKNGVALSSGFNILRRSFKSCV